MTFANIMVHLDHGHANDARLRVAGDLAGQFNARLIGIATAGFQHLYNERDASFAAAIAAQRSDITHRLAELERQFRYVTGERVQELEWRSAVEVRPIDYISSEARAADLIITGTGEEGVEGDHLDPGELVMRAGRPVLIVPPEVEHLILDCAIVAFNDTREARRAVSDALPLLQKVRQVVAVEIIYDEAYRSTARVRLDDLVAWLRRHGVAASARVFDFPTGTDALDKLWQYGADFLVAGAYGHTQFQEWIFGSFTRDLLRDLRRCVFLAH